MQPDAADETVLFVDDMVFTEIRRLLGVNIDRARGPAIWDALEAVQNVLAQQWADGGTLATIDPAELAGIERLRTLARRP